MKSIKSSLLILALALQACSKDNASTTELEGTWLGVCNSFNFDLFDTNYTGPPSMRIMHKFQGNAFSSFVQNFSDTDCATLESTTNASEALVFVNPDDIPVSFTIGKPVTSANGVSVKEIDFTTADNTIQPNIYLLQDNSNTLYYGATCIINQTNCVDGRPTEIHYEWAYTKVNE